MKHYPFAACSAAVLALAGTAAMAQSSVVIGGTLDLALRQVKNGSLGTMRTEVSGANATSKLIIRGTEDLGGGFSAGFFLDGTILADTGGVGASAPVGQFWDRRSTVSLAHKDAGELRLGRDWVPTHLVWTCLRPLHHAGHRQRQHLPFLRRVARVGPGFRHRR